MIRMETEEGLFWTRPHESDPDRSIIVCARKRYVLESMLNGIELAGVAFGRDFDDLAIYRVEDEPSAAHYEMVLARGTLVMWFDFEVHNYQ